MRQPDFKYFILDAQGRPYVGNVRTGQVTVGDKDTLLDSTGAPAWLKRSPDGWRDVLVKYARNTRYLGLFRDFTVPMKMYSDAALICRHLFWTQGTEAYAKLVVVKNDRSVWPDLWKTWYVGELDFSKFKQGEIGEVIINAMEGGLSKVFKAKENQVYKIPVDSDPERIFIKNDGILLTERANFALTDGFAIASDLYPNGSFSPFILLNREGSSPAMYFASQNLEWNGYMTFDQKLQSANYFAIPRDTNTGSIDLKIKGKIKFICNQNDSNRGFQLQFLRSGQNTGNQNDYEVMNVAGAVVGQSYEQDIDITIPLAPNENCKLEQIFYGAGTGIISISFLEGSELYAEFSYREITTYQPALYLSTILKRLMEKATDGQYTYKSDYLDTVKHIAISSGEDIRGIEDSFIKTSLSEFFEFCQSGAIEFCGLGIENEQLVIEPVLYFFRNYHSGALPPLDLGQVDKLEISPMEDFIFSSVKIGYDNQEYEDVNGRYEFNCGQVYSTDRARIVKELAIVSPWRADPIGIELLRRNYKNKDTSDSKGDGKPFVFNIETDIQAGTIDVPQHYRLYRPAYTAISGLPMTSTIYNTEISPKHNLNRVTLYLRSLWEPGMDDRVLKLETGDKNVDLSTTLAGVTVAENSSIPFSSMPARLFYNYYLSFTTSVNFNLQKYMKEQGYETIMLKWEGVTYYVYLWEGGVKDATMDKQTWKCLAAPINDYFKHITKV